MKHFLIILFTIFSLSAFSQNRFPSLDSAKNYTLRFIKNSAVESFTNWRMQNVTYGTLELLDSLASDPAVDSIWKSGDTLKYSKSGVNYTIGTVGGSIPTLQQVTTAGNTTTDSINVIDVNKRLSILTKEFTGSSYYGGVLRLNSNANNDYLKFLHDGQIYLSKSSNLFSIYLPDSSGTLTQRVSINGTTYNTAANGVVNLGTDYIKTGDDGSLRSLTITGTNGNGHIHLRHQSSLPTATGQSTVIYANSNGDFAYKNDGNYHTTFATSANSADRTYTFQNKSYTVADNADVFKYTDTLALLLKTQLKRDTLPLAVFNVGSAAAGDTTAFTTSTLAGSFYLDGTDTMFITSYRVALQGTSASVTPDVWFNDSLNVTAGGTKLVTSPSAITNLTTGTSVTPDTNKIPPGNFVFVRFSAVTTKPTYFTLTLFGYRIRKQ